MSKEKLTLVKYNYESFPKEWKNRIPNKFEGMDFVFLGEIKNMEGHGYYQHIESGKPYILHIENMVELTEDDLSITIEI